MRQMQTVLALILIPIAFILLWSFPDYVGVIASSVAILASIFFYVMSERQSA